MRHPFAGLRPLLGAMCMAMGGVATHAYAEENFELNQISFLATNRAKPNAINGLGTDSGAWREIDVEHFGLNRWGYFYFDLESYNGRGVGTLNNFGYNGRAFDLFAVAIPEISLAKVTGKSFTFGPISDVALVSRLVEASYYRYRAAEFGLSLHFGVPGWEVFETGLLTHNANWDFNPGGPPAQGIQDNSNTGQNYTHDTRRWMWRTFLISKPILIGNERFNFNFLSLINTTGDRGNGATGFGHHGTAYFVRAEALWNIGGNSDYQLGLRVMHSRYRGSPSIDFNLGDNGNHYKSTVPYLMFKYTL